MNDWVSISGKAQIFSSPHPGQLWGLHSILSNGPGVFPHRVKRPGHEANHSPQYSVKVNVCGTPPPPPNTCMARCLVKHQQHFIFTDLENGEY
jgi:hypothetical protein